MKPFEEVNIKRPSGETSQHVCKGDVTICYIFSFLVKRIIIIHEENIKEIKTVKMFVYLIQNHVVNINFKFNFLKIVEEYECSHQDVSQAITTFAYVMYVGVYKLLPLPFGSSLHIRYNTAV